MSVTTPFISVSNINRVAGRQSIGSLYQEPELAEVQSQLKVIMCEVKELLDNWEKRDLIGMRDDIPDVLFTVYGLGYLMGFPSDMDLDLVCDSQYSKFDRTLEDAALTKAKYEALGIEVYQTTRNLGSPEDQGSLYIVTRSSKDQKDTDGKDYPKDKWLKSVKFKEPVFSNMAVTVLRDNKGAEDRAELIGLLG